MRKAFIPCRRRTQRQPNPARGATLGHARPHQVARNQDETALFKIATVRSRPRLRRATGRCFQSPRSQARRESSRRHLSSAFSERVPPDYRVGVSRAAATACPDSARFLRYCYSAGVPRSMGSNGRTIVFPASSKRPARTSPHEKIRLHPALDPGRPGRGLADPGRHIGGSWPLVPAFAGRRPDRQRAGGGAPCRGSGAPRGRAFRHADPGAGRHRDRGRADRLAHAGRRLRDRGAGARHGVCRRDADPQRHRRAVPAGGRHAPPRAELSASTG